MRAEKALRTAVFVIIICLLSLSSGFAEVHQYVVLTILHVNDLRGRILPSIVKSVDERTPVGGAAYLAQLIEDERSKNPEGTILLSAGDMVQGSSASNIFQGQPVIEIMNYLKFDAMALGNHECDWGLDVLKRLQASAGFPFLSATVTGGAGEALPGVKPFVMFERKGLKIAVIGVTTPGTDYRTRPDGVRDLIFLDPSSVLPELVRKARGRGANIVVVLSHSGLDADRRLAGTVEGIDLIVGGHSHATGIDPERVGKTIIVQAGYHGINFGVLNLIFQSGTGAILTNPGTGKGELKTVFAGPANRFDVKAERIVASYRDQLKTFFARVVGETSVDLARIDSGESLIGDAVTDAMREATGADVAFAGSEGIRTGIPKGQITAEQVFSLLPSDDVLMTMDLTGKEMLRVLERGALEMGVLQMSGIRVFYKITGPEGSRVLGVNVGNRPLEMEKVYRVTVNGFLAAGGYRFVAFKEGKDVVYGDTVRDAFLAYLQKHSPLNPRIEDRSVAIR